MRGLPKATAVTCTVLHSQPPGVRSRLKRHSLDEQLFLKRPFLGVRSSKCCRAAPSVQVTFSGDT